MCMTLTIIQHLFIFPVKIVYSVMIVVFPLIFFSFFKKKWSIFLLKLREQNLSYKAQLITLTKFQSIFKSHPWSFHCLENFIITRATIPTPTLKVFPAISMQVFAVPVPSRNLPDTVFSNFVKRTSWYIEASNESTVNILKLAMIGKGHHKRANCIKI